MHYPSVSMQGSHFDATGYQSGLYNSLNYDGSSIKLHHGPYPDPSEGCYSGYHNASPTGSYGQREPPSYAESTVYNTGFMANSNSSYYKLPGRTVDIPDYGAVSREHLLLKTEVCNSDVQGNVIPQRYDNTNRLMPDIEVNVQTDDTQNIKHENEVSEFKTEFKTDLSLQEALSPNNSDCISSSVDIKEADHSDVTNEMTSDINPDAADEDKARGNSEIKPALSYIALIAKSILESNMKRLSLGSIYSWIEKNYPYYLNKGQGWRNSVRHNLSLNDCFMKAGRCEDGKGNYWAVHPANLQDFMRGDFRQRRRSRRRGRKKDCDLGMYVSNGYFGASPPLPPSVPFSPSPALSSIYSPYTDAERRAYRLDDALLRQSMNNPFMKWYQGNNGYGNQQSGCSPAIYGNGSPQWQTSYPDQASQGVYPLNAFSTRNYTTPTIV